ncbi:hypothetical protein HpBT252_02210 [Helicobacter pylori]
MSAKRFEFSSYYKVLYIFYPYLATLKRVLFEFMAYFTKHFYRHCQKRAEPQSVFKRELKILTKP